MKHQVRKSTQRGAQIVEFALVFPFLLLVILLTLDFGFVVYNKAIITNAAREAARNGITLSGPAAPWSVTTVTATACDYARNMLITTVGTGTYPTTCGPTTNPAIVVTTTGVTPPAFGDRITVKMTYTYKGFLSGINSTVLSWPLKSSSTMYHE